MLLQRCRRAVRTVRQRGECSSNQNHARASTVPSSRDTERLRELPPLQTGADSPRQLLDGVGLLQIGHASLVPNLATRKLLVVAAGYDHFQIDPLFPEALSKLDTVHSLRHHHVRKQKINPSLGSVPCRQRLRSVGSLKYRVAHGS